LWTEKFITPKRKELIKPGVIRENMLKNTLILKSSLLVVLGLMLLVLVLGIASEKSKGEVITVDDSGGADYTIIQEAIDAARDGDTVAVRQGTYSENIVIDKRLRLVGDDSSNTIINGSGSGDLVTITADWVNFTRFNLTGTYIFSGAMEVEANHSSIFDIEIFGNLFVSGVSFRSSDHISFTNNRIVSCLYGIRFQDCKFGRVEGVTCQGNLLDGISLSDSFNFVIKDNILDGNGYCMDLYNSENNTLLGNEVSDSTEQGILVRSASNRFFSNVFTNDGFRFTGSSLSDWNTHVLPTNNTVNGKPVHYLSNLSDSEFSSDAGQVIVANCTRLTVKDQDMSNTDTGIIGGFSRDVTVRENQLRDCYQGLALYHCGSGTVSDNLCERNEDAGIYLYNCLGTTVSDNDCRKNDDAGIELSYCELVTISENDCIENVGDGIYLSSSNNCTVSENTCRKGYRGIYLGSSHRNLVDDNVCSETEGIYNSAGIYVSSSDLNVVSNNSASHNGDHGIELWLADGNLLENNICNNNDFGIQLSSSNDNRILGSTFTGNHRGINLEDEATNNSAHQNDILDNSVYGAAVPFGSYLNATMNWWGDNTGPHDGYDNPGGKGDDVWGNIDYDPWTGKDQINQKPFLSVEYPGNITTVRWDLTVRGTVQDSDSDIQKVEVRIDSGPWQQAQGTTDWSFSFNTTAYQNGAHSISVRAYDGEIFSGTRTVNIVIDNPWMEILRPDFQLSPEDITLSGPKEKGKEENITVTVANAGNASGVVDVRVYMGLVSNDSLLHNETLEIGNGSSAKLSFKWTPPEAGSIQLIVVLEDNSTVAENNTGNNQAARSFTIGEEGDPGGRGGKDDGNGDDSFISFLFEEPGPLPVPLLGYIIIGVVLVGIVVGVAKKGGPSKDETHSPDPSPQAVEFPAQQPSQQPGFLGDPMLAGQQVLFPPQQFQAPSQPQAFTQPQPGQFAAQPQQFQTSPQAPAQPSQQAPQFQQYSQTSMPPLTTPQAQQWGQTNDLSFPELPESDEEKNDQETQAKDDPEGGMWTCPKCEQHVAVKHMFCINCGNKRNP